MIMGMDSKKSKTGWLAPYLACGSALYKPLWENLTDELSYCLHLAHFNKHNLFPYNPWTLNLCTTAVTTAIFSTVCSGIYVEYWRCCLGELYIYINHEWSRCASHVHKDVRPLPSARFQYAAAAEPAGLPSWSKSLRHNRAAAAWWSRRHILPAVHVQPCPICELCRSTWEKEETKQMREKKNIQVKIRTLHSAIVRWK